MPEAVSLFMNEPLSHAYEGPTSPSTPRSNVPLSMRLLMGHIPIAGASGDFTVPAAAGTVSVRAIDFTPGTPLVH
jgi:hypothetical protein